MSQEHGNFRERTLEARAATVKLAGQVAIAMALRGRRPQVRFEQTILGRSTPAGQLLPGWVVDQGKYAAGMRPGGALENGQVLGRELLLLGTDGQLRTAYENPRRGYEDMYDAKRVFNGAGTEGWKLRIDGEAQPLQLRALRDHDAEGASGDYFLSHGPTLYQRSVQELSVVSELSVQSALSNLAREHSVEDIIGAPTAY